MVRPKKPKVQVSQQEKYIVEKILNKKVEKGITFYFLKWQGYASSANSWEPASNLDCPEFIESFEQEYRERQLQKAAEVSEKYKKRLLQEKASSTAVSSFYTSDRTESEGMNNVPPEEVAEEQGVVALQQQHQEEEIDDELIPNKRTKRESKQRSSLLSFSDDHEEKTGFGRGLEADRVIGATDQYGELQLLVLWEGLDEAELIPAKICNEKIPQLVISFYEERSRMQN